MALERLRWRDPEEAAHNSLQLAQRDDDCVMQVGERRVETAPEPPRDGLDQRDMVCAQGKGGLGNHRAEGGA